MKKNIFKILLFAVMFFSFQINANATINKCVSEGTCMIICSWENTYEYNINKDTKTHDIYLYYHYNGTWEYEWGIPHNPYTASQKSAGSIPTKHIFYANETAMKNGLLNSGNCPSKAYVDVSGMGISEELCLDNGEVDGNGKTYCHRASNIGTSFKGTSKASSNWQNMINVFYSTYVVKKAQNVTCADYTKDSQEYGSYRINEDKVIADQNQLKDDFIQKKLNNNSSSQLKDSLPSFVNNSLNKMANDYKNLVSQKLKSCVTEMDQKAKDNLSSEDYNRYKDLVEQDNVLEKADEILDETYDKIMSGYDPFNKIDNNISATDCTSLLGDPSTDGTPAFYLNVAFNVIKYIAIIILIVFSVMDFLSATASQDNDAIKKATTKAVKRLVYCIIIFVLPYLLKWILTFLNDQAMSTCGIGTKG